MPQVGWIDPASGAERPFDDVLAEAEAYGSALDFPFEILLGMATQVSGKDRPEGVTVTQLSGCLRRVELERQAEFYSEPSSTYAAFRGTLAHSVMEKYSPKGAMIEKRYFRKYKGVTISGALDSWRIKGVANADELAQEWHEYLEHAYHIEDGQSAEQCEQGSYAVCPGLEAPKLPKGARFQISDYKTKHEVPTYTYLAKRYQQQANCYIWLLRLPRGMVDVEFVFMSMEGVKVVQLYDGGKFSNGRAKPEQFWKESELEAYFDNRLMILEATRRAGRPLPYDRVEDDDLWNCNYCPVKPLCYKTAAEEARKAWAKGETVDRLPPRAKK